MDKDNFEWTLHVDADIFLTDKRRYVFKDIGIRVDDALKSIQSLHALCS